MANNKHPWKIYETRWITSSGDMTLSDFATEIGVSKQVVCEYAKKNDWVEKRNKLMKTSRNEVISDVSEYEVARRARLAKQLIDIADSWVESKINAIGENPASIDHLKPKEIKELVEISDKLSGGTFKKGTVNLNISGEINSDTDEDKLIEIIESGGGEWDG